MRTLTLILGLAACGSEPGLGPADKPEALERPANVVLIVLDTVRADHLSAYGYARPTTPYIDALARHGTRYVNAVSTAPWTLPSHASMFTGLPPHEHGAHGFRAESRDDNDVHPLRRDVPVLAEILKEQGYTTAAYAANNVFLTRRWGLSRGFDTYDVRHRHAAAHNRRVFAWLDGHARADRPFFLFVNYIDAHRPYNVTPHATFLSRPVDRNAHLIDQLRRQVMGTDDPVPEDLRARVIDQYDNAISHMDTAVGELMLDLARRGLRERTVVIVTSDHGEYFGEHRMVEHNMDVYQPGVHVPLIVYAPWARATVDHHVVTSEDMPAIIGRFIRSKRVQRALARLEAGPGTHPALAENYYSRPWDVFSRLWGHRFQRVRRAVFDWPYKLIHSSDGAHELYDLHSDADELRNLAEQQPNVARRLVAIVERDIEDSYVHDGGIDTALTDAEVEQMRALGYVE